MADMSIEAMRRLDGRLVSVFLALLDTHNATTAAERLGLSQSAISHALRRLRALHGDPLFVRRPHGLEPTTRAIELGEPMREVARCAQRLYGGDAEFEPLRSTRRFAIAAPEFVSATIGGPLLARWRDSAPGVSIAAHPSAHAEALDGVRRGELQLAIGRFAKGGAPDGLRQERLHRDGYCAVVRQGHPTIGDSLDAETYFDAGHVVTDQPGEGAPGEVIPRRLVVSAVVPSWLTALSIVATSDRIATCPRRLALQHADLLGLRVLDLPGPSRPIDVSVVTRTEIADPATRWLLDEIRAVGTASTS
ncbi:MAG: LysR family transcriptional regulator [Acidimicrobiales bacterium]